MKARVAWTLLALGLVSGCTLIEIFTGFPITRGEKARVGSIEQRSRLYEERANLLAQYRECLKRSEDDPAVNCSEYRTAIEVVMPRP